MTDPTASPPRPPGRGRRILRFWPLLLAVLVYLAMVWALPRTVDERVLRDRLEDWGMAALLNSTDVFIDETAVGMNALLGARVDLHGLRIDSPNAEFETPLLTADPVRIRFPLWGYWGAPCRPRITLRKPRLTFRRDGFGGTNLAYFCDPAYATPALPPSPLGLGGAERIDILLDDGLLVLDNPMRREHVHMPLRGVFEWRADTGRLKGELEPVEMEHVLVNGETTTRTGNVRFARIALVPVAPEAPPPTMVRNLLAEVEDVPLRILNLGWPSLPEIPAATRISGKLAFTRRLEGGHTGASATTLDLDFAGRVAGLDLPLLGFAGDAEAALTYGPVSVSDPAPDRATPAPFTLRLLGATERLTLQGDTRRGTTWRTLRVTCTVLDLAHLPPPPPANRPPDWLDWLLDRAEALEVDAEELRLLGLHIKRGRLRAEVAGPRTVGLALGGTLAGGAFTLRTPGWFVPSVPETLDAEVTKADAKTALAAFASYLPASLRRLPDGTGGTATIRFRRNPPEEKGRPAWSAEILLQDLHLAGDGGGTLPAELVNIPAAVTEVERARRALEEAPDADVPDAGRLEAIRFTSLRVLWEGYPEGERLLRVTGTSPELGVVSGGGKRHPDGTVRVALVFQKTPETLWNRNPALAPEVRRALVALVREEGLRLDFTLDGDALHPRRRYVEDAYRVWTNLRAAAAKTGSRTKETTVP